MENYIIYMHITPNNKKYIGITKLNPNKRWRKGHGYKDQYFYRAINKYGWDNIQHIIIAKGLSKETAEWIESQLISIHKTYDNNYGYNIALESTTRLSYNMSTETKQKISNAQKGNKNHFYGKTHSNMTKEKISIGVKNSNRKFNNKKCTKKNKPIICLTTKKIFFSFKEAADYYNINYTNISNVCRGKYKTAKLSNGLKTKWKYINYKHNKRFRKL